jgi:hypothetical protein
VKSTTYALSSGVPERAKTPLCGSVSAIEAMYLAAGTRTELGARYGVDPKVIRDIKLGRKWSHATGAAKEAT